MSFPLFSALLLVLAQDGDDAQAPARLKLSETTGSDAVSFAPDALHWRWDEAGELLIAGKGKERRWIQPESGEEVERPGEAEADATDEEDEGSEGLAKKRAARAALEALEGVDDKLARRISNSSSDESQDESAVVYHHEGSLYFLAEGEASQLVDGMEGMEFVDLAPDGSGVAFVHENDLYLVSTSGGELKAVTTNGGPERFNGKLDWVYQEEIYGRGRFKAFSWSPDSAHVAFLSLDESPVHEFTVVDHIEEGHHRVLPEVTNYPKAGDPNPIVSVGVVHAGADRFGETTWLDLDRLAEVEPLVVRFDWTPDGGTFLFCVQDRLQTWADLNAADPETGEWTTWIHEDSDSWVNRPASPRWLEDGSFLWESERTGYRHLYRYSASGELVGTVTSGEWAVGRVLELDEASRLVWFTATKDGAVNTNVYRAALDGSELIRLTQGDGRHSLSFNADRSLFLDRYSSLASPGGVRLCRGNGEVVRELAEAEVPPLDEYAHASWELVQIPARDGFVLDGALLKPVDFDPSRVYPVWLPTYSGPNAPSVANRWNSSAWYQFLAQNGVIVLQVNVRTASGRGRWATSLGYKRFGVLELRDLEDAVAWVTKEPWADADRVGITGYSYGGFMTAYAMCKSESFALGIAGGGVYEWSMYDTVYTERYMRTPQDNPEGYAETSVIQAVEGLDGHLVLHHGTMDDNVHMQNVMHLVYALQKAGKSFELMLYPQARHGVRDSDQRLHLRELEWKAIREHLNPSDRNPG